MFISKIRTTRQLNKIRQLVRGGTITMDEAEALARPYMIKINLEGAKNAKKKGEPFTPISFEAFLMIVDEYDRVKEKAPKGIKRSVAASGDIASSVKNAFNKKEYAISTVPVREGLWQTALALVVNRVDDFNKPLFIKNSYSENEAQKLHTETELMVRDTAPDKWPKLPDHIIGT